MADSSPAYSFTFLGTAAGTGVPSFFCTCPGCQEARQHPSLARGCCGAVLRSPSSTVLIDSPPDLRHQLEREDIRDIDALIFTHMHFDHVGGLGELEYYIRLKRKAPLPTFCSAQTYQSLASEFGYMLDCFDFLLVEPENPFMLLEHHVEPFAAAHAPGTLGYIFTTPHNKKLCYCPDTTRLPEKTLAKLSSVDHLIWDATFWGENLSPHAHQTVEESLDRGIASGAKNIYLTHLSPHTNNGPVYRDYLQAAQKRENAHVALDGMQISLD